MAKKLTLDGIVGLEITSRTVRGMLESVKDNDIEVDVSSPGGLVSEGLKIFDMFEAFPNKVTFNLIGVVASIMSYIVMAGDNINAKKNSIFVIHEPWTLMIGNRYDLLKEVEMLEGISGILAKEYSNKTGKSLDEIKQMMKEEAYIFSEDIKNDGFADDFIQAKSNGLDKNQTIAKAKLEINNCLDVLRESKKAKGDLEKAYAMIKGMNVKNEIMNKINSFDSSAKLVDESWSKSESESRWRSHAGVESSDDLPNSTYDKRFVIVLRGGKRLEVDFKLPIWDYKQSQGGAFVNIAAVRNGLARVRQISDPDLSNDDLDRAEAVLQKYLDKFNEQQDSQNKTIENRRKIMTKDELKAQHPDVYNEILNEGINSGVDKENKRCLSFVDAMNVLPEGKEIYIDAIKNKKEANDASVQASILAKMKATTQVQDNSGDATPPVNPEKPEANDDEKVKALSEEVMALSRTGKGGKLNG